MPMTQIFLEIYMILTKHLLFGHAIPELRCQIGYWLMSVAKMTQFLSNGVYLR